MAAGISVTCPKCGKKVTVRAELEGKKIRCKDCKNVCPVKASAGKSSVPAKGKSKAKSAAADARDSSGEDDSNPYGITAHEEGYRCPVCANEMDSPEAIVCLHCGFNIETRQPARTRHILDTTPEDRFMWLLPGILAVLGVPVMIVIWVLYHFSLPYWIFGDKWDEVLDAPEIHGSRNRLAGDERLGQDSWYSFLFHYGIEVWLIVAILFGMFFAIKFAIQRLILHPEPPEMEK
jgi:hypothetical protein